MKQRRMWLTAILAAVLTFVSLPWGMMTVRADNRWVLTDRVPSGKTGKTMTISFTLKNSSGHDIKKMGIGFDNSGVDIGDEDEDDIKYGYAFPLEVTSSTMNAVKSVGSLKDGSTKTVSLSGKVRRDLQEGYYTIPIGVYEQLGGEDDGGWYQHSVENIRVWIGRSTSTDDDDDDETKTYDFVLGEGQNTPNGIYPNVLNFTLNLRNNSPATVYNVKASLVLEADSEKFPFEINDANYDKRFEKMVVDETVGLDYSFAIREDAYSGYYPVGMKITYSTSSTGEELKTFETSFFVRINNKDKEDETGEFNEHDRTKARIIIDSFTTDPETIIAGDDFTLILNIKNASNNITASNLLFSMESEKVSDSAVFTTESGSSSIAVDSLGPGAQTEIRYHLRSRPAVDQRSYGVTVKAKFDSPEFKNAEESLTVDIPVRQIPRLNVGSVDIMPEAIEVGGESNIMFGINNTGKVLLYNVMVQFKADSIQTADAYVGNIKPGETGNVDTMVTGVAPTMDDGIIQVIVSFEDENGEVTTEQREMRLYVTEAFDDMADMEAGYFDDEVPVQPSFMDTYKWIIIAAGAAVILLIAVIAAKRKKNRKKQQNEWDEDEDEDNEIS